MRWPMSWLVLFLVAMLLPVRASAQDDGARAYLPGPADMDVLMVLGVSIDGNRSGDPATIIEGAELSVDSIGLMYSRTTAIQGKPAAVFVALPYGRIGGRVRTTSGDLSASSKGFGDVMFGASITLLGAPPTTAAEYVQFKPSTSVGLLVKVTAPTGQYDVHRPLNLGANRWMLQVGAPIIWYVGDSMVDPGLLTFELMPSVSVFTDNSDVANADRTSQRPVYRIEGHISKSFLTKHFVSLDGLFTQGGETEVDGVPTGNSQRSLALGATYSYSPNATNTVRFTYGRNVHHNDSGMEGDMVRALWIHMF